MSCGLLIAAGLMIKSVVQLKNVQMPFAIENVLTARVDLPRADYPDSAASIRFFEQLLPQLQAVPGVEAATLSDGLPAAGNGAIPVQIEGKAYPQDERLSARARGHRHARLLRDVPDAGRPSGREFNTGDSVAEPAGGHRQRVVRADAFPGRRSARPPVQAHPSRQRRNRG